MINERDLRSVEVSSWLDFKTEHERFPVWSNEGSASQVDDRCC